MEFDKIKLKLFSPERIKEYSYGEVQKPETINYKTSKPEMGGLFCERIFGPTKDYECYCGKYKRQRLEGRRCDRCGVEITRSSVRRERFGHIELECPVVHIWFFKSTPNYYSELLSLSPEDLKSLIAYQRYIVLYVNRERLNSLLERIEDVVEAEKDVVLSRLPVFIKEKEFGYARELEPTDDVDEHERRYSYVRKSTLIEILSSKLTGYVLFEDVVDETGEILVKRGTKLNYRVLERMLSGNVDFLNITIEVQKRTEKISKQLKEELKGLEFGVTKNMAEYGVKEGEPLYDAIVKLLQAHLPPETRLTYYEQEAKREFEVRLRRIRDDLEAMERGVELLKEIEEKQFLPVSDLRYLEKIKFIIQRRASDIPFDKLFKVDSGGSAIRYLLQHLDLDAEIEKIRAKIQELKKRGAHNELQRLYRKLGLFVGLKNSGNKPEWLVITRLPVIPPDLRPMVQLEGGRHATSDLNDLYRYVITRNNRLKRLKKDFTPLTVLNNERRLIQDAVDALLANKKKANPYKDASDRPYKSLTDAIGGKEGRFRQNLLGKRVDYSGRAVIVVGPELKLWQCGVPKTLALELFRPYVIAELWHRGYAENIRMARKMIERVHSLRRSEAKKVWDVLKEVVKNSPVLLNRAPTLHRLGIQAFEPILVEGNAIRLHPLVCAGYNADFDGDQMAIYLPLSVAARAEARFLMLSAYNLRLPANANPITHPNRDMVVGLYYLTSVDRRKEVLLREELYSFLEHLWSLKNFSSRVKCADFAELNEVLESGWKEKFANVHKVARKVLKLIAKLRERFSTWEPEKLPDKVASLLEKGKNFAAYRAGVESGVDEKTLGWLGYNALSTLLFEVEGWGYRLEHVDLSGCEEELLKMSFQDLFNLYNSFPVFSDLREVEERYNLKKLELRDFIWLPGSLNAKSREKRRFLTTVGRAIFNSILPEELRFRNETMDKSSISAIVAESLDVTGRTRTVYLLDDLKVLGFRFATVSGLSMGMDDVYIPAIGKEKIVRNAHKRSELIDRIFRLKRSALRISPEKVAKIYTALAGEEGSLEEFVSKMDLIFKLELMEAVDELPLPQVEKMLKYFQEEYSDDTPPEKLVEVFQRRFGIDLLDPARLRKYVGIEARITDSYVESFHTKYFVRIWSNATQDITRAMERTADQFSPLYMMVYSGARGNKDQMRQLVGMRGLMADASGNIVKFPITSNFREGLTVHEYFISTHGARKGSADTALRTSKSGYLTRRLVDLVHDVYIETEDCGTDDGVEMETLYDDNGEQIPLSAKDELLGRVAFGNVYDKEGNLIVAKGDVITEDVIERAAETGYERLRVVKILEGIEDRIWGKFVQEDVYDVVTGELLLKKGDYIEKSIADRVGILEREEKLGVLGKESPVKAVKVRSPLTCKCTHGVCQKCYGRDLAEESIVEVGTAVGVIAAQAIGEPGTQLTLRTFHTGGIAGEEVKDITQGLPLAEMFFELHKQKFKPEKQGAIIAEIEGEVEVLAPSESKAKRNIRNVIKITSPDGETKTYDVPKNRDILVRTGEWVKIGDKLTDGYVSPLDVLRLFGRVEAQRYIVRMIQSVYLSQGVKINPKHIEIVVRQMGKFCRVVDPGDSDLLIEGQLISRERLAEVNKKIEEEAKKEGRKPNYVKVEDVLLGVKKAALSSDSFLSAASFQETSKVLAKAAFFGMEDKLRGLKENVIIGRRIPVGTGFRWYREFEIVE